MTEPAQRTDEARHVPISEGLYVFPPEVDKPALLGSRCRACGLVMWPKQTICAKCFSDDTYELPLSRRGTVWSSTVVRQAPGDYKGPVPYAIGVVELPEGAGVRTVLTECDTDEPLPIGTEVELSFEEVGRNENGEILLGHRFTPLKREKR
jgi:uncharacterized OB-fold protein